MLRERFRASVQYDDFTGSAAADRVTNAGPEEWLRAKGLLKGSEFIVGIELWAGENHGVHRDPVTVHFLVAQGTFDSVKEALAKTRGAFVTRRISESMPIAEFLGLFKRFSVALSPGGMLSDKNYSYPDE